MSPHGRAESRGWHNQDTFIDNIYCWNLQRYGNWQLQFLQCLNKMRIKQSAAWCWAPKSSPCHQMVSRHHCSSLTFSLREPGRDKSERCNKVLVTKVSWGCWKPLFRVCATLSPPSLLSKQGLSTWPRCWEGVCTSCTTHSEAEECSRIFLWSRFR